LEYRTYGIGKKEAARQVQQRWHLTTVLVVAAVEQHLVVQVEMAAVMVVIEVKAVEVREVMLVMGVMVLWAMAAPDPRVQVVVAVVAVAIIAAAFLAVRLVVV
jgi:hypothetical protein